MRKSAYLVLFTIYVLLFTVGDLRSQIVQLVTTKDGFVNAVQFVRLGEDSLHCRHYRSLYPVVIALNQIQSVVTLGVEYENEAFDVFLSGGKKIIKYEKIGKSKDSDDKGSLYASSRLIGNQTVILFKMRVNREDAYLDIIPDLRAGTGVRFEFKSGSKLSCEIENVYVFTGSAEPDNMYNLGYVILRPGDVAEFVNNELKSITIGEFNFKMEDPELLKRHVLALNDGLLYFER